MLCERAARPTTDCLYTDCSAENRLLKIWNRSGANFALAAFNVSDGDVTDKVDFGCIPGLSDKAGYVAYEYFTKTFIRVRYSATGTMRRSTSCSGTPRSMCRSLPSTR